MNIGRLAEDNIQRFGEYDYVYFEGQRHTNVEMNHIANRLGNALKNLGIKKGDRVGVQLFNYPQLIQAFLATFKIGAIVVPINPSGRALDMEYIFRDSGVKALVTSIDHLERVNQASEQAPELQHIILIDSEDTPGTISYNRITAAAPEELTLEDTDNDDIAALLYTAGTTGKPKGVMLTHFCFYANCEGYYQNQMDCLGIHLSSVALKWDKKLGKWVEKKIEVYSLNRQRVSLLALPLFHSFGIGVLNMEFLAGGRIILLKRWDVAEAMRLIDKCRVTDFRGVPTMFVQLLSFPEADKYDLSSLEVIACGAAPMPLEIMEEWNRKYGVDISEGYGLTEAAAINTGQPRSRPPKYGSVGKCVSKTMTAKIFDANDQELPPREQGEIVLRGPTVMKGYWNMPEETKEILRGGWLHTGDIGYKDEEGYIYLTERKKDLIIRGGENVYPKEVEDVLYRHSQVLEVGVIGIPDSVYGEEVKAFVSLKPGETVGEEELIGFCKQYLPTYKRPKTIQLMDSLPKSEVGKILRKELRAMG